MGRLLYIFIILLTASAWGLPTKGSGKASVNDKVFKPKSAIAVWDKQSKELVISFFNVKLTKEHLKWMDSYPADYQIADAPTKKPYLRLTLEFKDDAHKKKFRSEDIDFQAVTLWRMRGDDGISAQRSEAFGSLQLKGNFRVGNPIRFQAKGSYEFSDGNLLKWDVKAHCRVYKKKTLKRE